MADLFHTCVYIVGVLVLVWATLGLGGCMHAGALRRIVDPANGYQAPHWSILARRLGHAIAYHSTFGGTALEWERVRVVEGKARRWRKWAPCVPSATVFLPEALLRLVGIWGVFIDLRRIDPHGPAVTQHVPSRGYRAMEGLASPKLPSLPEWLDSVLPRDREAEDRVARLLPKPDFASTPIDEDDKDPLP